jgi:transcriptional regulator with GAF, ATPase, and Fis domain
VAERALILARNGVLQFALPNGAGVLPAATAVPAASNVAAPEPVLTEMDLQRLQERNLAAALHQCHGKVHGPGGAAELLGLKPTTLLSRIKKLGLDKQGKRR